MSNLYAFPIKWYRFLDWDFPFTDEYKQSLETRLQQRTFSLGLPVADARLLSYYSCADMFTDLVLANVFHGADEPAAHADAVYLVTLFKFTDPKLFRALRLTAGAVLLSPSMDVHDPLALALMKVRGMDQPDLELFSMDMEWYDIVY